MLQFFYRNSRNFFSYIVGNSTAHEHEHEHTHIHTYTHTHTHTHTDAHRNMYKKADLQGFISLVLLHIEKEIKCLLFGK